MLFSAIDYDESFGCLVEGYQIDGESCGDQGSRHPNSVRLSIWTSSPLNKRFFSEIQYSKNKNNQNMELKESFFLRILCVKSWSVLKKIIFHVNLLVVNGQQVKEL